MAIRYLIALLAIFTVGACGSSDTAEVPNGDTTEQTYNCRPHHTPPDGMTVAQTYEDCNEKKQQTVNSSLFDGIPITNGAVTVTFTGFGDISPPSAALFFIFEVNDTHGHAMNMHAFFKGGNYRYSRLVHHYWETFPKGLQARKASKSILIHPEIEYTWDCTWNASAFTCHLKEGETTQVTYVVSLVQPFYKFWRKGLLFGNKIERPQTSGTHARATSIRFTAFQ